jgi:hypothetical protein
MGNNNLRRPGAIVLLSAALSLTACQSVPDTGPRELLDERTGATLIVVSKPLIFARVRTDVAANARDYLHLVAVEADRSGKFTSYLLAHYWSTVDRRMSALPDKAAGKLVLQADGREINLIPMTPMPAAFESRTDLHAPRAAEAVTWVYAADLPTMLYIAESRDLSLRLADESLPVPFVIWSDGREALREFAQRGVAR